MPIKKLLGFVVIGLAGWLFIALVSSNASEAGPSNFTSSKQCAECHADVYAEWETSWHAQSWVDADVRALSNDFANTDCIDCHAPRPVFETGVGKRVLPRASRRSEGVDCIACHQTADGRMAGTMEMPSAACRPVEQRELQRADFCGVCHDQHKTVQQWLATPYPEQGVSCIDCHMPWREGDPNNGRDHSCRGGHDIELVRSAVELRGARDGEGWSIEIENVGAGHAFPTDERSRAADVFWRPLEAGAESGTGEWRFLFRIRDPYRHEVDIPRTLIDYGDTRTIALQDAEATGSVEVALFYKLTPYYTDPENRDPENEASLVHRIALTP